MAFYSLSIHPEFFEAVVFTRLLFKYMYNNIPVIEQGPMAVIDAFFADRPDALQHEFMLHEISDSLDLGCAFSGTDHKIISNDRKTDKFEDDKTLSLFLESCFRCLEGQIFTYERHSLFTALSCGFLNVYSLCEII